VTSAAKASVGVDPLPEALGHVAERPGEQSDLIAAFGRTGTATRRSRPASPGGRRGEPSQRHRDRPREERERRIETIKVAADHEQRAALLAHRVADVARR